MRDFSQFIMINVEWYQAVAANAYSKPTDLGHQYNCNLSRAFIIVI